jgi:hypothetical protein
MFRRQKSYSLFLYFGQVLEATGDKRFLPFANSGLVAPSAFIKAAGGTLPIAPCDRFSLYYRG